ncbi:MAG: hypothetical protein A2126_03920 [Candidatus Woykebacteria bacterium GWB1_45_5]|uniref:Glycosidase n=1 Tax=Candidatus Woykebacteria bacterium GWB1_45_5 TaxID=1802592 RepID=A0A1G1W4J2_9BACT|nr:MAG: hypothetical protein A2126_03920 [Candidatus Woykebacteria bacterium GWB1_45_5]
MKLTRCKNNPILTPTDNWWEEYLVFNPGVAVYQDKIYLLYRAQGRDKISRFGLATSVDGFNFERFTNPIFEGDENNKFERLGVEDPRITKIDDTYYIFYTAASVYPLSEAKKTEFTPSLSSKVPWRVRASLMQTSDFKTFDRIGIALPDTDTKDLALFQDKIDGKYFMLHRMYPNMYLASSSDLKTWQDLGIFAQTRPGSWDEERIGVGAPPIKTEKGWLLIYHGVDQNKIYRLGVMLLDLNDPTKILYRSSEPIFEPEASYEKEGYVKNVVFTCGAIEKDGQYFVYYGAADKVIGLATIGKEELLTSLQ